MDEGQGFVEVVWGWVGRVGVSVVDAFGRMGVRSSRGECEREKRMWIAIYYGGYLVRLSISNIHDYQTIH